MKYSEIATRYATALFSLATNGTRERVVAEIRELKRLFEQDDEILDFVHSPLIKADDKVAALEAALSGQNMSDELKSFVLLLAKKGRLRIFEEIEAAFEALVDEEHGVSRGVVESAIQLDASERQQVENTVAKATGRKVILNYKENPDLIGGLVARVGSFTFDDSLISHLRRLTDQLNRSVQ